ncbi:MULTISPECIES: accessory Sec system translocase SecA2 [Gordonia]|nr:MULTISPECIES: accessory Sec system translocase SecA2 [Gordonia]AZZ82517.1 accessory Sec system translocase SecA2 [Gordonia alkanivorans]MDH3006943.1 accessory Sec system translocase SecA2 [Gordonia alkanivorans]MDH3011857.1 accessory Sec system translocase SecA2 [Gordonia alkanivorans]MDH3016435.1 accessory Sec system translocase SecA2 [Gordonia alkanivorans]MDH3020464.1 accessory Sec system translocase SecA2 [Gordonia alkanivorans]
MGKLSNSMWRLLGAQSTRNQSKSLSVIKEAETHTDWAAELADDAFVGEAEKLDIGSKPGDRAKFLALVREAADRSINLRPFDVQLQGALRLLEGDIVEMATGEGKTLAGAIAAIGYVLEGHQVHVISVNDYLATRDAEWMKPLFDVFGIAVHAISENSSREERRRAYAGDVTYGSVNEIGFDVLRDQLALSEADLVSPKPDVAIIDEADSVLVDEALVPLVLAGSTETEVPDQAIHDVVSRMKKKHYEVDAEGRNVTLTDEGAAFVEEELGGINLYSEEHVGSTLVHVSIAMHAHYLLERDIHYIVRDGGVHLINASRGRVAQLQRWPDGVQAAVELKEGLAQTDSGEVIDTITVQALIGRYPKVCGMTGTALAAGEQFRQFYDLRVSQIPPNTENIRTDLPDRVYDTKANKVEAIVAYVKEIHETGQPVLIGTHDVAESEELAYFLEKAGVSSVVLNAKNDAQEAKIIAEAGALNAVTVSTQMAGRGTDIRLGGSADDAAARDAVVELGGLCVVGTGRHDTERLDSQLRGRAGRQGDPGTSVFFSSLEDPVVTKNLAFKRDPVSPNEDGSMGSKGIDLIEQAQRIAEGVRLELHANTWRYNKLVNQQRDIIVDRRMKILTTDTALDELAELEPERYAELTGEKPTTSGDAEKSDETSKAATETVPREVLSQAAREIVLYHLDRAWADHLAFVSDVRASIHLRSLGKESPLDEFHRMILAEFSDLPAKALEKARETFREAEITADGVDLGSSDLHRSTTTWTYMVHDNLFSSGGAKTLQGIIGIFR